MLLSIYITVVSTLQYATMMLFNNMLLNVKNNMLFMFYKYILYMLTVSFRNFQWQLSVLEPDPLRYSEPLNNGHFGAIYIPSPVYRVVLLSGSKCSTVCVMVHGCRQDISKSAKRCYVVQNN